ncbi:MAG: hypothetical protein NTY03_01125 [Candidatus Bathyarchaeota archaeon]|nr:hypothetical protein [Candidatus Bathyarchaeota archaeon]
MKLQTVYVTLALLLVIITITGVLYTTNHTTKLEGITSELTNSWFGYVNETDLYAYGAQITLTNTQSSTMILENLRAEVYGVGGDKSWSQSIPITSTLILPPGGAETIDLYSKDLNSTTLGVSGANGSGTGYLYSITEMMNRMIVKVDGTARSQSDSWSFSISVRVPRGPKQAAEKMEGSHYSGPFWFLTPTEYFTYEPLHRGVLGTAKFPYLTLVSGSNYNSVSLSMVDARTLTVLSGDGPKVYYLMDGEFRFDTYLNGLGRDGDQLYFYGRTMNYVAPNGGWYRVLQLTEVSVEKIVDPAEVARSLIVSQVGEPYFREYFSGPSVDYRPGAPEGTHVVSYSYHIVVGNYSSSHDVVLYFDPLWRVEYGSEMIPRQGNLQPFNVTREIAEEIAVKAGVPSEPYGLEAFLGFSGHTAEGAVNRYDDKYVWNVWSWIDPMFSNPRKYIGAIIDPVSGEVYAVHQGGTYLAGSIVNAG